MDGHRTKVVAEARTKGGKAFVTGDRPKRGKGVPLFDDDDVDLIPGVGAVLKRKLADVNITTVGELKAAGEDAPVSPAVRSAAAAAAEGAYLSVAVDHRKADNPYESLHGAAWREHIDKTPAMQKYVSIQTLWTDVMDSTVEGFRGTTHENDFRIYHDALSQLTADATKEWLKTKRHGDRSWFDIWITPLEGLNAGTCFFGRPVGNSPELMPLDCSLLADLSHDLSRHVRMTKALDNIDPKKFSRSTPGRLSRSLRRLLWHSWDDAAELDFDAATGGSPSARRILQDIAKCMKDHILAIIHAKGAMVDGIGNRAGRRERPIGRHGGLRTKLPAPLPRWVHPHAVAAARAKVQLALQGAGGAGVAAAAVAEGFRPKLGEGNCPTNRGCCRSMDFPRPSCSMKGSNWAWTENPKEVALEVPVGRSPGNRAWVLSKLCNASPNCFRLFWELMRLAAVRTFCTAGTIRPTKMAMMAITTSNSIRVKAVRRPGRCVR